MIEQFLENEFPDLRYSTVDNFYVGPYNSRKLSKAAFIEFPSQDSRRDALILMGGKNKRYTLPDSSQVTIKPALDEINKKRNWALRKATDLIKAQCQSSRTIKTNFDHNRNVTVDDQTAFKQESNDLMGSFRGEFRQLSIS